MAPDDFQTLMARLRRGDPRAAEELVARYQPTLLRLIRVRRVDRRLSRAQSESDIFQAVMASFFVRATLGQYDLTGPEDLLRLLAIMVRNKVADEARRKDLGRDAEELEGAAAAVPAPGPSPSVVAATRELAAAARARLPADLREVLALRDESLGWNEIATRVGGTPEGLRKRWTRAIDDIARDLGLEPREP